jgi:glycosyltransferase involved in cell wall biosynthesis
MSTPNLKVLEVIPGTDRGGVQAWLLDVLRQIDRNQIAIDFFVRNPEPGECHGEIVGRRARVFVSGGPRSTWRHFARLRQLHRTEGPYDIIHAHVHYYGGLVVLFARLLGVRVRLVHGHGGDLSEQKNRGITRWLYVQLMKLLIQRFSTGGLGTSRSAAAVMFGHRWASDSRWKILSPCVDFSSFDRKTGTVEIRTKIGIPQEAIVIGHVGRFADEKNHHFLVEVANILAPRKPRVRFVLIGGGPLQGAVERAIRERSLESHFIILAPRDDIPQLMLGAMDYFLFPSLYEGLGLALVEAQAAGLRCMASAAIPPEAIAVPSLVRQKALADGPEAWAEAILRHLAEPVPVSQPEALRMVQQRFDIRRNAEQLVELYRGLHAKRPRTVSS